MPGAPPEFDPPADLRERVESLVREGGLKEAAALAEEAGWLSRAAEIYADAWEFIRASDLAQRAGLKEAAYRYATAGRDAAAIEAAIASLLGMPEAGNVAEWASARGRHLDAARLWEAAGDSERAGAAFVAAGEHRRAAECAAAEGDYRRAGKLYEAALRADPHDALSALRLARILLAFGRAKPAIATLQRVEHLEESRAQALSLMVEAFDSMGLTEAAGQCLERLRDVAPETPATVAELLAIRRGAGETIEVEGATSELLAGRYRLGAPLGAGGAGRVFAARDAFHERDVAIKVLHPGVGSRGGRDALARFAREARLAGAIEHPNVVAIYEWNASGPFLVMEHMRGGTLASRLDAEPGRFPLERVRHIVYPVLSALEAVHRRGITHRDVKPANIFFGAAGEVKLGDFGAAHLADLESTLTSAMVGTLAYMSPEQLTGGDSPRAATDLYAFGILLFRLVTGALPFPGPDFLSQHLHEAPPRPSALAPSVGARFDALVEGLLAKSTDERPADAALVRARLDAIDWVDPERDAIATARIDGAAQVASRDGDPAGREPSPPPSRFVGEGGAPGCVRDTLVGRDIVELREVSPPDQAHWIACARADHPNLQAVYEVDAEFALARLEAPTEPALDAAAWAALPAARRAHHRAELRAALASLHRGDVLYGPIDWSALRVGEGRAVLMLPSAAASASASREVELAALDALLHEP